MRIVVSIINRFFSAGRLVVALGAPSNLRLVGVTQQHLNQVQIQWAWDAVMQFGSGATSVAYQTQHKEAQAAAWTNLHNNGTSTTRTIAVTEDAGARYQVRVRARNNLGEVSPWVVSASVAATTGQQPAQGRAMEYAGRRIQYSGRNANWGA